MYSDEKCEHRDEPPEQQGREMAKKQQVETKLQVKTATVVQQRMTPNLTQAQVKQIVKLNRLLIELYFQTNLVISARTADQN
jgi:hypothetical protein